ncbi:MAG: response regulator [Runella zeae]
MKKFHVLLIDDDLDEFEFFLMALEKIPSLFKCTHAASGQEAIKLLDELQPDFIFVDMNMPRWNGLECIKEIKKHLNWKAVPIILYSTSIDTVLEGKAKSLGVVKCIIKPLDPNLLTSILQQMAGVECDFVETSI